jgi:hypothetical protein
MSALTTKFKGALDALKSESDTDKKAELRRKALEMSDQVLAETGQWLEDSGVFEAFKENTGN